MVGLTADSLRGVRMKAFLKQIKTLGAALSRERRFVARDHWVNDPEEGVGDLGEVCHLWIPDFWRVSADEWKRN